MVCLPTTKTTTTNKSVDFRMSCRVDFARWKTIEQLRPKTIG